MLSRILDHIIDSIAWRMVVTGIIVGVPMVFAASWLGAAYLNFMWNVDFTRTLLGLLFFGLLPGSLVFLAISYPIERWIIRDRAKSSLKWVLVRALYLLPVGALAGLAALGSIRLAMQRYPSLVEGAYFVLTIIIAIQASIIYTFIERAAAEVQSREAELKKQLHELRVEIDAVKRQRQVSEIVETEFFADLQTHAREMRAQNRDLATPDAQ
jgi:hypothetical protein